MTKKTTPSSTFQQLSHFFASLAAIKCCVTIPLTAAAVNKKHNKTIGLYQNDHASATTSIQVDETDNIIFTTYLTSTAQHTHSFTYGSGTIQPPANQLYITSLSANTPKEAFHLIPSHTIFSTNLDAPSLVAAPTQQQFFAHGLVYNHGNLAEIKAKLRKPNQIATPFSHKPAETQADVSLTLGQDITLNTNNKVLLTAEVITRNISRAHLPNLDSPEIESEAVFSLLLSNNTFLRKQIAVSIVQPEHQAPTINASIVYFLYGPRFFSIHDIHQPSIYFENINPLIAH